MAIPRSFLGTFLFLQGTSNTDPAVSTLLSLDVLRKTRIIPASDFVLGFSDTMNHAAFLLVLFLSTTAAFGSASDMRASHAQVSSRLSESSVSNASSPFCVPHFVMPSSPIVNPDLIGNITIYQGDYVDGFSAGGHSFVGALGGGLHFFPLVTNVSGETAYVQQVQVYVSYNFVNSLLFTTSLNEVLGNLGSVTTWAGLVSNITTWVAPPFYGLAGYEATSSFNSDPYYGRVLVNGFIPLWAPLLVNATGPRPVPCRWTSSSAPSSPIPSGTPSSDTCGPTYAPVFNGTTPEMAPNFNGTAPVFNGTSPSYNGSSPSYETPVYSPSPNGTLSPVYNGSTPTNDSPYYAPYSGNSSSPSAPCVNGSSISASIITAMHIYQGYYVRGLYAEGHPLLGGSGEFSHAFLWDYVTSVQVHSFNDFVTSIFFVRGDGEIVGSESPAQPTLPTNVTTFTAPPGYGMVDYNGTSAYNYLYDAVILTSFFPIFGVVNVSCGNPAPITVPSYTPTYTPYYAPVFNGSSPSWNDTTGPSAPSFNGSAPSYNSSTPAYNGSVPSYNDTTPSYNSSTPYYNGTAPSWNGTTPSNSPSSVYAPAYNGTAPVSSPSYNGTAPYYNGAAPSYNGTTPVSSPSYNGTAPFYNGTAPVFVPSYNGSTPHYNGSTPFHNGTVPFYNGTTPSYNGTAPSYNGTTPSFHGTAPVYAPSYNGSTPHYNGSTPHYNGSSPFYNGTTPYHNGTAPSYNGTTPSFNGTNPSQNNGSAPFYGSPVASPSSNASGNCTSLNPDIMTVIDLYQRNGLVFGVSGENRSLVGSTPPGSISTYYWNYVTGTQVYTTDGFISAILFLGGDGRIYGDLSAAAGKNNVSTTLAPQGYGMTGYLASALYNPTNGTLALSAFSPIFGALNFTTSCPNGATSAIVGSSTNTPTSRVASSPEFSAATRGSGASSVYCLAAALLALLLSLVL